MNFRNLNIPLLLDTSSNNLIKEFFQPVLINSIKYDRGVGYFSSSWLRVNASGLNKFASNGGHARWVTSPILSDADWKMMCVGNEAKQNELLYKQLSGTVADLKKTLEKDELSALAWMIADEIINFKLALPRNQLTGEFHDKFGIFTDKFNNKISFSGSYNDSQHGLLNYESITIFKSWEEEFVEIVIAEENRFTKLWENEDPNVRVFNLPEAIKLDIVKFRGLNRPYMKENNGIYHIVPTRPVIPENIKIRDYQNEAVNAWFANQQRGFIEMATGTGKTITSLLAAVQLFSMENKIALIITCPYIHLVDQWQNVAQTFNFFPVLAFESYTSWKDKLSNKILAYNSGDLDNICVITTHTTFSTARFTNIINKIRGPSMLIADEAHHLGSENSRNKFPFQVTSRLALSATPNRWFDEEGTKALIEYFGNTIYSFSLGKAIQEGFLSNYYYYPIPVYLIDKEIKDYMEITQRIVPLLGKKLKLPTDEERLKYLLIKRSNILKNAENKLIKLDSIVDAVNNMHHTIFYCSPEQKGEILRKLGVEKKIRAHQFTYEENNNLRQEILDQFDNGSLQAIVAIKCLDEGVDIPSSQTAYFLANSSNPREFIQRRGRVLRKYPGKDYASLYDFLTFPPITDNPEELNMTRNILRRELNRFKEFAENSNNFHTAYDVIWDTAKNYGVFDF